jgi:hypothetical protein
MIEKEYSIDEILLAVDEIQNKKKKKNENIKKITNKKDFSEVPKNTLRLIEEAEKVKN